MILIQINTLAEQLGVHRNTIRNWVKTGKIAARPAPGRGLMLAREDFLHLCEEYALDPAALHPRELALAPSYFAKAAIAAAPSTDTPDKPANTSQVANNIS